MRSPGSPSGPPNSRFSVDAFLVDHAGVSKAVIGSVGGGGAIHIGRPLVGQLHFATESLRADGWSSDVPHLRVVGVHTSELGSGHSPGLYRLDQTRWTPWSDVRVNVAVCVQACIAIRQVYCKRADHLVVHQSWEQLGLTGIKRQGRTAGCSGWLIE